MKSSKYDKYWVGKLNKFLGIEEVSLSKEQMDKIKKVLNELKDRDLLRFFIKNFHLRTFE
jgi:hypothetical protein